MLFTQCIFADLYLYLFHSMLLGLAIDCWTAMLLVFLMDAYCGESILVNANIHLFKRIACVDASLTDFLITCFLSVCYWRILIVPIPIFHISIKL